MENPCPSTEQLQLLLDGHLSDPTAQTASHVQNCERCQSLLDLLVTPAESTANAEPDLRPEFLDRLRNLACALPTQVAPRPQLEGYELREMLGQGGMGQVYQAWDQRLTRLVAVKYVRAQLGDKAQERLRIEAQAGARLRHAGIVQVHDILEQQGQLYLVMELCPGGSLAGRLRRGPLEPHTAAALVQQLAGAVQFAHETGLIHRDLKPSNVLLMHGPEKPVEEAEPKIADFGLVKQLEGGPELTESGETPGTPSYMAPEQVSGEQFGPIAPATDVYALGAILYETLTRRPPFLASRPFETMLLVKNNDPLPVRRLQPKTPRDLESICVKCLEKEPTGRYASAAALAEDLGRFLRHEPVRARPIRWTNRLQKFLWRHRLRVGIAAGVLLLFAVLFGFWLNEKLEREADIRGKALALREQARQQVAGRQEEEGLRLFDEALRLLDQLPGATALRAEIEKERAIVKGPVEARQRLARLEKQGERIRVLRSSGQPTKRTAEAASQLLQVCEDVLRDWPLLERDDWEQASGAPLLMAAERDRLRQLLEELQDSYFQTQRDLYLWGGRVTGLGLQLWHSPELAISLPRIGWVESDSLAAQAGLQKDDRLLAIDGTSVRGLFPADAVIARLNGKPQSIISLRLLPQGSNAGREVVLKRNVKGGVDVAVAPIRQLLVQHVPPDSVFGQRGVRAGDWLVGINGQPAEGELRVKAGQLHYEPLSSLYKLFSAAGPQLTLVLLRPDDGSVQTVALEWGPPQAQAMHLACAGYLAQNAQLLWGAVEWARTTRNAKLLRELGITDVNAPTERHLERYYVEQEWWPPKLVRAALARLSPRHQHYHAGVYLHGKGEIEEALRACQRELSVHRDHAESYLLIGQCAAELKRWREAATAWSAYVGWRPNQAFGYRFRGEAFERLGALDLAEQDYQKAVELFPGYPEAQASLERLRQQQPER